MPQTVRPETTPSRTSEPGKAATPRRSVKREAILDAAERLFYENGFHATGIDRIVSDAGVTPRTLYHHFASKDQLVQGVLRQRETRYFELLDAFADARQQQHGDPVRAVFEALANWLETGAAQGCIFISALNEYANENEEIAAIVSAHKTRVRKKLQARLVDAGYAADENLVGGLLLLMEGATSLAPVLGGKQAALYAIDAAQALLSAKGSGLPQKQIPNSKD